MRRGRLLAVAALLLLPGALLSAPTSPPLYDGLGFPDEPYRTVAGEGAAPTPAAAEAAVFRDGSSPPFTLQTGESGPQATLAVPQGALALPDGAARVRVRLDPVAVPVPLPRTGRVLSNAYDVVLQDDRGRPVALTGRPRPAVVRLRIPAETAGTVVLQRRDGTRWRTLPTRQVGVDVYSADLDAAGAVVAVLQEARLRGPDAGDGGSRGVVLVCLGAGAALAGAVVVVRRAR